MKIKVNPENKEEYEVFSGDSTEHRFSALFSGHRFSALFSGVRNWDLVVSDLNQGGVVGRPFVKADIYPVQSFSEIRFYAGSVYRE